MDIGEEKKEYIFEPLEAPAEQPVTPEPVPAEREPVPDADPVPVGSGVSKTYTLAVPGVAVAKEPVGV